MSTTALRIFVFIIFLLFPTLTEGATNVKFEADNEGVSGEKILILHDHVSNSEVNQDFFQVFNAKTGTKDISITKDWSQVQFPCKKNATIIRYDFPGKSIWALAINKYGPANRDIDSGEIWLIGQINNKMRVFIDTGTIFGENSYTTIQTYQGLIKQVTKKTGFGLYSAFDEMNFPALTLVRGKNEIVVAYWDQRENWAGYCWINSYKDYPLNEEETDKVKTGQAKNNFRGLHPNSSFADLVRVCGLPPLSLIKINNGGNMQMTYPYIYGYKMIKGVSEYYVGLMIELDCNNGLIKTILPYKEEI